MLLVVEGDGDVTAAPVLARRVLQAQGIYDWTFPRPQKRRDIAHLRGKQWSNFSRYLQAAFCEEMPILWLLDCDDGCALHQLRDFQQQAESVGVRQPLAFGFWVREYECLFVADLKTTGEKLGIKTFKNVPADPEAKRGVKEWLSRQMPKGTIYKETLEQEKLSAAINLDKLRAHSRSFRHFEQALLWLIRQSSADLYPIRQ